MYLQSHLKFGDPLALGGVRARRRLGSDAEARGLLAGRFGHFDLHLSVVAGF